MSAGGSRQRRESGQPQREAARRSAGNEVGRKRTDNVRPSQPTSSSSSPSSSQQPQDSCTQVSKAAGQSFAQMDSDMKKRKVSEMVRYLLMSDTRGTPVRKKDLVDHVLGPEHSRAFPVVLEKANLHLTEVFGMKAEEVVNGKTVCYVLVNCLPSAQVDITVVWSDKERSSMGLLFVVLSVIMLKPLTEEQLWGLLEKLGIRSECEHAVFGDVKATISHFVDMMYLRTEKLVVGDTAKVTYQWGPRAVCEVDKRSLLKMVAELHGGDPGVWERQYQSILQQPS